jgi:hypothetical protein
MESTMLTTTMKIVLTMMIQPYKPSNLMSKGERTIGANTTMRVRQNFQMLRTGRALTSLPQSAPPPTSLMVYSEARNIFFYQQHRINIFTFYEYLFKYISTHFPPPPSIQ